MANVLPPQIDFPSHPVPHTPSPLGFGFGFLASNNAWHTQPTPGHHNPLPYQNIASTVNSPSIRAQKRRYEPEDDVEILRPSSTRDVTMERSPTPDRPRRIAPKRFRLSPSDAGSKLSTNSRESKSSEENDVDVGVLLASLPSQSLLPIMMSLLNSQPSLKSAILPLIPRPTLETAIDTLTQSSKKLRDAYPYSNASTPSQASSTSPSVGFGFGQQSTTAHSSGGMRDSYILSRLRPHIADFTAACMSYLPYFSYLPSSLSGLRQDNSPEDRTERMSAALQALHKDRSHPSETFIFLSAITNHFLSQPPLTQTALADTLLPRLVSEWKAWVERIDEVVNRQGGMFGSESVHSWGRGLDDMSGHREYGRVLAPVRDNWILKVGWLVGRSIPYQMEEL